jgi:hypothetical protein
MTYPKLDLGVAKQRQKRAIQQMRVGDIVECWLDCTPDAGKSRPLPIVIVALPNLRESYFKVKELFTFDTYDLHFAYQWRIVGHIDGFSDLIAAEAHARIDAVLTERNILSALGKEVSF